MKLQLKIPFDIGKVSKTHEDHFWDTQSNSNHTPSYNKSYMQKRINSKYRCVNLNNNVKLNYGLVITNLLYGCFILICCCCCSYYQCCCWDCFCVLTYQEVNAIFGLCFVVDNMLFLWTCIVVVFCVSVVLLL